MLQSDQIRVIFFQEKGGFMPFAQDKTVISCERCVNAVDCRIMNPYVCDGKFSPEIDTNFNMTKEYKVDEASLIEI